MGSGVNIVAHNLQAMFSERQLGIVTDKKAKSAEKLSSGYRINRSADDAAGLAISEKMRRQVRGLTQGTRNAQDGISMCQIADGALAEVHEMLGRITQLSVQSANDTNNTEDRQAIQQEVNQLLKEIDRVSDTTTFNEQKIFSDNERNGYQLEQAVSSSDARQALLNRTFPVRSTPYLTAEGNIISSDLYNETMATLSNYVIGYDTWNKIENSGYKYDGKNGMGTKALQDLAISVFENCKFIPPYRGDKDDYLNAIDDAISYLQMYSQAEVGRSSDVSVMSAYKCSNTADNIMANWLHSNGNIYVDDPGRMMLDVCGVLNWRSCDGNVQGSDADMICDAMIHLHTLKDKIADEKLTEIIGTDENFQTGYMYLLPNWSNGNHLYGITGDMGEDKAYEVFNYLCQPAADEDLSLLPKSFYIQSGVEAGDGIYLTFGRMDTNILGINELDVSTGSGASNAIDRSKKAIGNLNKIRSDIGAQQNRLEHTIKHQNNTIENTQRAESQIRDTDMATEMMEFSALDIIQQSGQTVLAQANQTHQGVLSLLQ
ncbi:MAG: hypothetical protein K6A72_02310 [Lachnospiraceae bacterium]|nr:hypothetical protein [Lachnospiraceae bacterium]